MWQSNHLSKWTKIGAYQISSKLHQCNLTIVYTHKHTVPSHTNTHTHKASATLLATEICRYHWKWSCGYREDRLYVISQSILCVVFILLTIGWHKITNILSPATCSRPHTCHAWGLGCALVSWPSPYMHTKRDLITLCTSCRCNNCRLAVFAPSPFVWIWTPLYFWYPKVSALLSPSFIQ